MKWGSLTASTTDAFTLPTSVTRPFRIAREGLARGHRDGRDRRGDERDAGVAVDARFVDRTHGAGPFDALSIIVVAAHVPPASTERQAERSADETQPHDRRAGRR